MKAYLFLFSCEGVLLFPVVMLLTYFNLSLDAAIIYALIVVGLVKILSFYKSYIIFLEETARFANIFVLLCPRSGAFLCIVWRTGIDESLLKINF